MMSVRLLVPNTSTQIFYRITLSLLKPAVCRAPVPRRAEIESSSPTLPMDDAELAAVRLDETGKEEIVVLGMKDMLIKPRHAVGRSKMLTV